MPRRSHNWTSATSEQAFEASRAGVTHLRSHQMSHETYSNGKRKHELDEEAEGVLPRTPRTTKRTRTRATVASDNVPVIDLTAPTPSPKSTSKKRKQTSGNSPAGQQEEKRLRAFRKWAPKSYLLKLERARTQRYACSMWLILRQRETDLFAAQTLRTGPRARGYRRSATGDL